MEKTLEAANCKGLVEAAIAIARDRQETIQRLRAALEACDDVEALKIARKLCGLLR
jgi:hypothetical protein